MDTLICNQTFILQVEKQLKLIQGRSERKSGMEEVKEQNETSLRWYLPMSGQVVFLVLQMKIITYRTCEVSL